MKFSKGDCLTALGDAVIKCKKDDNTSTGGNAEPFNCANFGFIGSTNAPSQDVTAAAVITLQSVTFYIFIFSFLCLIVFVSLLLLPDFTTLYKGAKQAWGWTPASVRS